MLLQTGEEVSGGWGVFRFHKYKGKWEFLLYSARKQELYDWISDYRDYQGIDEIDTLFRVRRVFVVYEKQI